MSTACFRCDNLFTSTLLISSLLLNNNTSIKEPKILNWCLKCCYEYRVVMSNCWCPSGTRQVSLYEKSFTQSLVIHKFEYRWPLPLFSTSPTEATRKTRVQEAEPVQGLHFYLFCSGNIRCNSLTALYPQKWIGFIDFHISCCFINVAEISLPYFAISIRRVFS